MLALKPTKQKGRLRCCAPVHADSGMMMVIFWNYHKDGEGKILTNGIISEYFSL